MNSRLWAWEIRREHGPYNQPKVRPADRDAIGKSVSAAVAKVQIAKSWRKKTKTKTKAGKRQFRKVAPEEEQNLFPSLKTVENGPYCVRGTLWKATRIKTRSNVKLRMMTQWRCSCDWWLCWMRFSFKYAYFPPYLLPFSLRLCICGFSEICVLKQTEAALVEMGRKLEGTSQGILISFATEEFTAEGQTIILMCLISNHKETKDGCICGHFAQKWHSHYLDRLKTIALNKLNKSYQFFKFIKIYHWLPS